MMNDTPIHPEFVKWPSIQRLSSEICYITEKIDGTNGVIYVPEEPDKPVLAGSRERWLTNADGTPPEKNKDNFGFGAWVHERAESLRRLGPGCHYGEFHGKGIQRHYDLPNKRWASFEYWRDDIQIPDVCVVPVLYTGEMTPGIIESWVEHLRVVGSTLYPGFAKPEGVVVTFKNMNKAKFKKLCENDKIHKGQMK
jgi:hypothetical protein